MTAPAQTTARRYAANPLRTLRDPGRAALRRAARAAIVIPPTFAIGQLVLHDALWSAALDCLRRWRNDDRAGRGAMAVVIAGEWVENVARLEDDLQRPVAGAVGAARTPWWR